MATSKKATTARSATAKAAVAEVESDIYEVEESGADLPENRFKFRWHGVEYDVPKLAYIKPALVGVLDPEDPVTTMLILVNSYYPGLGDQFKDGEQLGKLFNAWATASGISVGE